MTGPGPLQALYQEQEGSKATLEQPSLAAVHGGRENCVPVKGPLQALFEEQEALKVKLKENAERDISDAIQRRNSRGPIPHNNRRSSTRITAEGASGLELISRPTLSSQKRVSIGEQERQLAAGFQEEVIKQPPPEETEEQKQEKEKILKEEQKQKQKILHGFHIRSAHHQQQREKYLEKERQKQAEKELSNCSFKPKPRRTKSQSSMSSVSNSLFDRAKALEVKKEARIQKIRKELLEKEMAECSFHPQTIQQRPPPSVDALAPPRNSSASWRPSINSDVTQPFPAQRTYTGINVTRGSFSIMDIRARQQCLARASESRPKLTGAINAEREREKEQAVAGNESDGSEYWNGDDNGEEMASLASGPEGDYGEVTILPSHVSPPVLPETTKTSAKMELTFDGTRDGGKSEELPVLFEHEKALQEEIKQKKKQAAKTKQAAEAQTVEQSAKQLAEAQMVSNLRRLSQGITAPRRTSGTNAFASAIRDAPRRTSGTSAFASAIRRRSSSAAKGDHVGEFADDDDDDPANALASLYGLNISDVHKLLEKLHPNHDAGDENGDEDDVVIHFD